MYSDKIKKGQKWERKGNTTDMVRVVDYSASIVKVMDIYGTDMGKHWTMQEAEFRQKYRLIQDVKT